jgi:hypothetical protein
VETAGGVPTANTGLFIDDGAKLAIVGDLGTRDVIGTEEDVSNAVIVVEGAAPVVIGAVQVYDNADTAISDEDGSNAITGEDNHPIGVSVEAGKEAVAATSPAQGTATVDGINFSGTTTTITFTGTGNLSSAFTVSSGKALIITGSLTLTGGLTVDAGGTLEIAPVGTVTVPSGQTLTLTGSLVNNGTVTLAGTFGEASTGTYGGAGTFEVSTVADLNKAVAFNVSTIKLNSAFYTAANSGTGPIVIDAATEDRTAPITIKGLGKTGTALTAGIWIANDNISLQDVNLNVTDRTKAPITSWANGYNAAVSIGRSSDGTTLLTGTDLPVKNVTVSNSTIAIDFSSDSTTPANFTAGIFVDGASTVPSPDTLSPAKNITISGNTISATGKGQSSVQGIYVSLYDYSVNITDNTITSKYGTARTAKGWFDSPASAIFLNAVYGEDKAGTGTPNIKNNVLNGNNASTEKTAYSFYVNAYASRTTEAQTAPYIGIAPLKADKFGLYETTWALDASTDAASSYKKVFKELLGNITGTGFGSVASGVTADDYAFEHYEISAGKVTSISVHGLHLSDDKYAKDGTAANKFGTTEETPKGKDYGSFAVENGEVSGAKNGKFKQTYNNPDSDYIYNN